MTLLWTLLFRVVTKPMVGVLDLASNVSEGIRNTTTVFEDHEVDRVRLPRFIAKDGILRVFDARASLGSSWVRQIEGGIYQNDTYVAHIGN